MTNERFCEIVEDRCSKIKLILANKAKEYARGDRLHNFKVAATIGKCTPTRALFGMQLKHLVSVIDMFDDIDSGVLPSEALLEEKFGDLINYLILAEACIKERMDEETRTAAFRKDPLTSINTLRADLGLQPFLAQA